MNKVFHRSIEKIIAMIIFLKVLLQTPFTLGMICPSSPFLTKTMAQQIVVKFTPCPRDRLFFQK